MPEAKENILSAPGSAPSNGVGMFLRFLGWFFLVALAAWIIATALGLVGRPPLPRLFGIDAQHASDFTFSAKIQKQLEEAQARMDISNQRYNTIRWLADLSTWASFLATAAITLITGGFDLPWPKAAEQNDTIDGSVANGQLRPMRFHTLGFLAAVASVCTLLGAQLDTKASGTLACAKDMRDQINEVAQGIKDTPENEITLLTRLKDATQRNCL